MKHFQAWNGQKWIDVDINTLPLGVHYIRVIAVDQGMTYVVFDEPIPPPEVLKKLVDERGHLKLIRSPEK